MISEFETRELIDSINDCHARLRNTLGKAWSENGDLYISNSEWSILAIINQKGQATQSCLSREINITRQATHKFIKNLMEKQVIYLLPAEHNKKEKYIKLTPLGLKYLEDNQRIKTELEEKIALKIGSEKIELLKEILSMDWGI